MKVLVLTLFALSFFGCSIAQAAVCTPNPSLLDRLRRADFEVLNSLVGTYRLSGSNECGMLKIEAFDHCEGGNYIGSVYDFSVNNGKGSRIEARYYVSTGPENGRQLMLFNSRVLKITNTGSSGGGIGSYGSLLHLDFDKNGNIESLDAAETYGVIFQRKISSYHCDVIH